MSLKAQVTGQFNLTDESANTNVLSFDLADDFGSIVGITEHTVVERELIDTDSIITIATGGVATIKGFYLRVTGSGVVTVKHDSNTAGFDVSNAVLLFGSLSTITIETIATQALLVKYVIFE